MTMIDPRFLKFNIINNLTQGGNNDALSAEQGKVLHQRLQALEISNNENQGAS